jgi:hypothetical protein
MKKYNLIWSDADTKFVEALLLATGGEGGAPLQEVLLMGDALDGTVFDLTELEQSLEKLTAIGYINVLKNKLLLTDGFLKEYEAASTAVPEISDAERIQELLHCHTLTESNIEAAREKLKKYKLKNYYQQYQEQYG